MKHLLFLAFLVTTAIHAQDAVRVSVCELKADPSRYNRRLVEVTGQVSMEFEAQGIGDDRCPGYDNSIWITFGGDVSDPEVYCCGNHDRQPGAVMKIEGLEIPIEKDLLFERLITTAKTYRLDPTAKKDEDKNKGPFYTVTATVVGRFFSGELTKAPDGRTFYSGYGHLGCCTLLAIQKVSAISNVASHGRSGELKCADDSWSAPTDEATAARQQASIVAGREIWRMTDLNKAATSALEELQRFWNDQSTVTFLPPCKRQVFEDPETNQTTHWAECHWKSANGERDYYIDLEKTGFLVKQYGAPDLVAWRPVWGRRSVCVVP